jgi:phosphomannomutase
MAVESVVENPIISVSGLRGIVGTSLTPLTVSRYVAAYARLLKTTQADRGLSRWWWDAMDVRPVRC